MAKIQKITDSIAKIRKIYSMFFLCIVLFVRPNLYVLLLGRRRRRGRFAGLRLF